MSKYVSKKGTTINIPDGLTSAQVASIKADADAGYGTRAQATATKLGQSLTSGSTAGSPAPAPSADLNTLLAQRAKATGTARTVLDKQIAAARATPASDPSIPTPIDNSKIIGKEGSGTGGGAVKVPNALAAVRTANDQTITDQNGNTRTIHTDPTTGAVTITDGKGGTAQTFTDLATAAASTFNGTQDRQNAYNADFTNRTQYLDRNKARDTTAAQQDLANRGIPYDPAAAQDPNTNNLYGKTLGAINENYAGQYSDAANQATLSGNAAYATDSAARDSFINAATTGATTFGGQFQPYQSTSGTDTQNILNMSLQDIMSKYGIDQDAAIKKQELAKSGSGSSSSGSSSSSSGGFEIA